MQQDFHEQDHAIGATAEDVASLAEEAAAPESARQLFATTVIGTLLPPLKSILMVMRHEPIYKAFKVLVDNHILSVPVFDKRQQRHVAFVDVLDFVTAIDDLLLAEGLHTSASGADLDSGTLDKFLTQETFKAVDVASLVGSSDRNPYYAVDKKAPLLAAVSRMMKHNIHRIGVVDGAGELCTLVTQSDVVRFISKNITFFQPSSKKTIAETGLGLKQVLTIKEGDRVMGAFRTIRMEKVSGVAVMSEEGMVGNISASDLKRIGFNGESIHQLYLSAGEFLKLHDKYGHVVSVGKDTDVEGVLAKMNQVHRVYVVEDGKPVGVISQIDILRYFKDLIGAQECKP